MNLLVRPRVNMPDLDNDIFKNYRAVANIPFQEKVIQRVVAFQTHSHLEKNIFYAFYAIRLPQRSLHRDCAAVRDESCSKDY